MKRILVIALTFFLSSCAGAQLNPFTTALTVKGQDYQRSMKIAKIARQSDNPGAAIDIYSTLLRKHPDDDGVLLALAQTYLGVGMAREALQILTDLEKADSTNLEILVGLGRANLLLYRPAIAEIQFEKGLQSDPANQFALAGSAISKDIMGRHTEARAIFRDLIRTNPNDIQTRNNMALSYLLEGDYQEAVWRLEKLAFGPGSNAKVRQNLALAHGLLGNRKEAERVGLLDLDAAAVKNNLKYYELLRISGKGVNIQQLLLGPRSKPFLPGAE